MGRAGGDRYAADMAAATAPSRTRSVPPAERLIVALDVSGDARALGLADVLGDAVGFYKLGLELATSGRYLDLVDALRGRGKRVFADLKLHDIPATVAAAVRGLAARGVDFATVHAGQRAMLDAACAEKAGVRLLAVTVLTSMEDADLVDDLGTAPRLRDLVVSRARRALEAGCDGVVASGAEARALRDALGDDFLVVSPGIRPTPRGDDQRRVVTPREAFAAGADYIVVGRPVRDAEDPRAAALAIHEEIVGHFAAAGDAA